MQDENKKRDAYLKIMKARSRLLMEAPFYGSLLMHLNFAFASCGTAGTDMRKVYWDPEFVLRLGGEEMAFVMLHEVLHCVLLHPIRAKGHIQVLYNIAADIVINSTILKFFGRDQFQVDGELVMNLTPDGQFGYLYTTEEVYQMLREKYKDQLECEEVLRIKMNGEGNTIDMHDCWEMIRQDAMISAEWKQYAQEAVGKGASLQEIPVSVRKLIDQLDDQGKIPWRRILFEYIQDVPDRFDYQFHPSDRRFSDSEFIIPGFTEVLEEKLEKIWFFVDGSGSVSDEMFTTVFQELKTCIRQFYSVSGAVYIFDTQIRIEKEFRSITDLENMQMIGKGGTRFRCIFEYLQKKGEEERPRVIVILTDGYAAFPSECAALGTPVLWIITDNERDAPWGKTIHVSL